VHAEPSAGTGGPSRPRRAGTAARIAAAAVVLGLGAALGVRAATGGAPALAAGGQAAAALRAAPGGTLTLLDHRRVTLASLRGRPVLVWFVAAGCSSFEASIPVVAAHLGAFTRAGTRVLVLGMYGVFGQGPGGTAALASFGKAAAGKAFASPNWTWGVASEPLTAAFDPSGIPDAYFLLDAAGRITYQNSVPVSTMGALLARLPARAAGG
jgi:hypothetical protein